MKNFKVVHPLDDKPKKCKEMFFKVNEIAEDRLNKDYGLLAEEAISLDLPEYLANDINRKIIQMLKPEMFIKDVVFHGVARRMFHDIMTVWQGKN